MSIINKLVPIIIIKGDDGNYYPIRGGGFNPLILPSEFALISQNLQDYCMYHSDDEIMAINNQAEKEFYTSLKNTKHKADFSGYVYMIRCADKYKIGYSKNVSRRLNELDTRPFKSEVLFTVYSTNARKLEQELHHRLSYYKETGEWYSNITETTVKRIIEEIAGELKCDIQY